MQGRCPETCYSCQWQFNGEEYGWFKRCVTRDCDEYYRGCTPPPPTTPPDGSICTNPIITTRDDCLRGGYSWCSCSRNPSIRERGECIGRGFAWCCDRGGGIGDCEQA